MTLSEKQAKCKQALRNYVQLVKITAEAQVKMLELLMHPECTDEMVLAAIHTRRAAMARMREARETLTAKLYEANMNREANALARTPI
jgi:ribosomal silencing factor RsfS